MAIFTLTDGLWIFAGCSAFWLYGLIGAWIGYRRYETFYAHCEKNDEYWIGCYFITVFLWPLRFPYDRARRKP